jgi:hypothetical protein
MNFNETNVGLQYPQDFVIDACTIVTAIGQPFDFSKMVVEINYFEDIYSGAITGALILNDSNGFLNKLSFNGNEFLMLSFGKPGFNTRKISKVFKIYSVSDRQLAKEQNENYVLNFCSEELSLSEQYKISKSYRNQKISDIVSDILLKQLLVKPEKFPVANIEETQGVRDIIIPNWKPFESINWLATQAISNSPKTQGSPYVFYENYYGYNFKSIQSLFGNKLYQTYRYEPKNLTLPEDKRVQDLSAEMVNVIAYEHLNNFDSLNSINTGAFANRLIAVDPIRQKYSVNDFDYSEYIKNTESPYDLVIKGADYNNLTGATRLNAGSLMSNAINRKGDTYNKTFNAVLKTATTNTGQSTFNTYIKQNQPDIKDINIEKRVPYRLSQLSQINTIRMKISIPGDPLMTVGNIIEFYLPEIKPSGDTSRSWDLYYSGRFLVTAVRHILSQENSYTTTMEISKESLYAPYANFDNGLPSWKELRSR